MVDIIRVDHDALAQIANRFSQQSEAVEQMSHAVRGVVEPLANGGWIGEGADAFFAEMNSIVFPAVQRLTDALAQAAAVSAQTSGIMQQADEEASSGFGQNGGGGRTGGGSSGGGAGGGINIDIGGSTIGIGGAGNIIGSGIGGGSGSGGNQYTVPDDWLDGVLPSSGGGDNPIGSTAAGGSAGGSTGGGSGSGAGGETAASSPSGGGSGSGSSGMDIKDPYGQSGSANGRAFNSVAAAGGSTAAQAAGFQYQSLNGMSSGGGAGGATTAGSVGGGAVPTAAIEQGGNAGLPFGLAAVTPFLALLGKAVKGQIDGD